MPKHVLVITATLIALASPSVAQDAVEPGMQAGTVDSTLVREVRQMALEADRAAAQPETPKSEEAIAAEKRAIDGHREGFFARVEERTK